MSFWDTGLKPIKSCPYMSKVHVFVPIELYFLAEKFNPHTEYMLYARAERDPESEAIIVKPEFCVPEQEVSYAQAKKISGCDDHNVVIHKHPSGVSHFSGTDDEYINQNNDVSILLEGGTVKEVVVKKKLPCGHVAIVEGKPIPYASTMSLKEISKRVSELIDELKKKMREKTYSITSVYGVREPRESYEYWYPSYSPISRMTNTNNSKKKKRTR